MKLIHQQDPAVPMTHVYLILPQRGACLDPAARRGLTRFMLRLLMRGAGGLSHQELHGRLERLGASIGASVGADQITFRLATLSAHLDEALTLFRSAVTQPDFAEAEAESLRSELVSAWIADREESKQLRAQEVFHEQLYGGRPVGYSAEGRLEGLKAAAVAEVRAHYADLLGGPAPLLAVLSDLPQAAVESRVLTPLAGIGREAARDFPWDGFDGETPPGRRVTIVPDRQTTTDEVLMGGFSATETDPDWHVHRLIAMIFGGDMNARLFRIVRAERGISYGASAWYDTAQGRMPRNRRSPFSFYTFPNAERTAEAVPLLLQLYEALVAEGVTPEELERARKGLINSHPFTLDTPQKQLAARIDEALYGIRVDSMDENRAKLLAVTPAQVHETLQRTHHPERQEIVLLGDPERLQPIVRDLPGIAASTVLDYP